MGFFWSKKNTNTKLNEMIHEYLNQKLIGYHKQFTQTTDVPVIFKNLYDVLLNYDLEKYEENILNEITTNCSEWWTNPEKGINTNESLDAILFEHDWDIFKKEIEATAYGIIDWKDAKPYTEDFDMGFEYNFPDGFDSNPGITMSLYDHLSILEPEELPDSMLEKDISEYPGFNELRSLFITISFFSVHKAVKRFVGTKEFQSINRKSQFMFIIEEHDSFYATPLWHCVK